MTEAGAEKSDSLWARLRPRYSLRAMFAFMFACCIAGLVARWNLQGALALDWVKAAFRVPLALAVALAAINVLAQAIFLGKQYGRSSSAGIRSALRGEIGSRLLLIAIAAALLLAGQALDLGWIEFTKSNDSLIFEPFLELAVPLVWLVLLALLTVDLPYPASQTTPSKPWWNLLANGLVLLGGFILILCLIYQLILVPFLVAIAIFAIEAIGPQNQYEPGGPYAMYDSNFMHRIDQFARTAMSALGVFIVYALALWAWLGAVRGKHRYFRTALACYLAAALGMSYLVADILLHGFQRLTPNLSGIGSDNPPQYWLLGGASLLVAALLVTRQVLRRSPPQTLPKDSSQSPTVPRAHSPLMWLLGLVAAGFFFEEMIRNYWTFSGLLPTPFRLRNLPSMFRDIFSYYSVTWLAFATCILCLVQLGKSVRGKSPRVVPLLAVPGWRYPIVAATLAVSLIFTAVVAYVSMFARWMIPY